MNEIVKELSLKEQLLELMMLDIRYFGKDSFGNHIPVTKLPIELKNFLNKYPLGGVILFHENLHDIHEIKQLTIDLQENSKFGRFIAVDEEGGVISRITGATETPGNMALGATNDLKTTTKVAALIGKELSALGINFNLAPCLDINSNPQNPIIGVRSFGQNPELVAKQGTAYIEGLQDEQIISCAKHFPGHGNVDTDSHVGDTYLLSSAAEIESCDLKPFVSAINVNVDTIMTAHIIAPALDNKQLYSNKLQQHVDTPATLSHTILTNLLRKKLGFQGIIISDALDMQAITNKFSQVEATILALEAGINIILMPLHIWDNEGIAKFIRYFNQVLAICENSTELKSRIKESCSRILQLKHFYTMEDYNLNIVGSREHQDFAKVIASKAITLSKNTNKTLPWKTRVDDKIMIISADIHLAQIAEKTLSELGFPNLETVDFSSVTIDALEKTDKVLVLTYNLKQKEEQLQQIFNNLNNLKKPYVMFSCRNPYDILYIDNVNTNILVYGATGLDQTNKRIHNFSLNLIEAITKVMTSQTDFNTNCPVKLSH